MQESDRVIDEYTLAAFLAGTLTEKRRQEVIKYLAVNRDAREVLHMAAEALEAARTGDPVDPSPSVLRTPTMRRRSKEPERRLPRTWIRGPGRYAAATVFVFVVGMVLRLAFAPPSDVLRSPLDRSGPQIRIEVSVPGPTLAWSAVENAYRYRLVVWDQQQARVAGQYETSDNELGRTHAVVHELREDLQRGSTYTLRIDAIDAQNRLVQSSETVDFVFE